MQDAGNDDHQGSDPHYSRAIAVMRPREHATEKGVAEQRKRYRSRHQRNIVQLAAPRRAGEDANQQKLGKQRNGDVNQIDSREIKFPTLLASLPHRLNFLWQIARHDAVGVAQPVVGAFTGCDGNKLLGGGLDGGLVIGRPDRQ